MTFQTDAARGLLIETLTLEYFASRGWRASLVPVAAQRRGSGDIRLECPRTLLVSEVEVKADFGKGPCCLLELATNGGRALACASGVLKSRADLILFVRVSEWIGHLFRMRELEDLIGDWVQAFVPIVLRDEGARTSRHCLPVPWTELERAGQTIRLRALETSPC